MSDIDFETEIAANVLDDVSLMLLTQPWLYDAVVECNKSRNVVWPRKEREYIDAGDNEGWETW